MIMEIENKNRDNNERMSKDKDRFESNRELDRQRSDHNEYDGQNSYRAKVEAAMRAATDKAERLIADEEARLAEELNLASEEDEESLSIETDPERIWKEKCEEEVIMNEQKNIAIMIVEDSNVSLNKAYELGNTSEILRLNSVLAQAKQVIREKDEELTIIEEEKNLAAELLAEILRNTE